MARRTTHQTAVVEEHRRESASSPSNSQQAIPTGSVGAIRLLHERRKHRPSLGGFGPPDAPVSAEVMNTNYEEWMKLATDNKINSSNTWSFALIDYFHDMSLLRNPDGTDSINFQKASCTLDGCVKIWTSRVDSVVTEAGKLLSGLADDTVGDAPEEDDANDGADSDGERRRKRKTARTCQTLVTDFEKLKAKTFDLEFTVDPLFKKTSADFDEGGASGILMNHLGCDSGMKVVFDAGDARIDGEDDDATTVEETANDFKTVNMSLLAEKCLEPDQINELTSMVICPSLSSFKFSGNDILQPADLSFLLRASQSDGDSSMLGNSSTAAKDDIDDFFGNNGDGDPNFGGGIDLVGDDAGADNLGGPVDYFDTRPNTSGTDDGIPVGGTAAGEDGEENEVYYGEDDHPGGINHPQKEEDIVMMMSDEAHQLFDYFDSRINKNWAGPEHWKVSKPIHSRLRKDEEDKKAKLLQKSARSKEKKLFSIDFNAPPPMTSKELFATAPAASITLKSKDDGPHTLPEDVHFSRLQLLRLFLKPRVNLQPRKRGIRNDNNDRPSENDIDEAYWARQVAQQQNVDNDNAGEDWDEINPMPFSSGFFHDDNEDVPDFDDDCLGVDIGDSASLAEDAGTGTGSKDGDELLQTPGGGDGGVTGAGAGPEDDLLAATQGRLAKRAKPLFVNYAKKAKRVDVKKLKENIWRGLHIEKTSTSPQNAEQATIPNAQPFREVLTSLRSVYPKERLEELSTSFCFICLLHLANEQGLRVYSERDKVLSSATDEDDEQQNDQQDEEEKDEDEKNVLGGIETLRVFKEIFAVS